MSAHSASSQELVITRTFAAPRELVFRAFSEAEHLLRWWGPEGFDIQVASFAFRPGGVFHYSQQAPGGELMWCKLAYREISPFDRLVFVNSFSDAEGGLARAPFLASWPLEIANTITFEEENGQTSMTMRSAPVQPTAEEAAEFEASREMAREGFSATFERLAAYLAAR
ncbi:SRPBCC family protein [Paenibacillus xanthanilyticus]|uniref:SRPBCC domain-containing protein n=1 Tax=Paenibacillus xanthanilyticus TaxID=1783531 RepID=A0ABV8KBK1_9BACL